MAASTGNRPLFLPCDITDIEALKARLRRRPRRMARSDVLVNNAANDLRHKTEEVTEEFWDWSQ
jgi:NADP-dependent 3-hydroxy acid dehydrogenase YdfG